MTQRRHQGDVAREDTSFSSRSSLVGARGAARDTPSAHRVIHLVSRSRTVHRFVGRTGQAARVLSFAPQCVVLQASFLAAVHVRPLPRETPRNPKPHSNQTAAPLKSDGITSLELDSGILIQYEFVSPLEQTAGGAQRLAYFCDFFTWLS